MEAQRKGGGIVNVGVTEEERCAEKIENPLLNIMIEEDEEWISNVWFSNETHFQLDSVVNNQNCRIWGTESPDL